MWLLQLWRKDEVFQVQNDTPSWSGRRGCSSWLGRRERKRKWKRRSYQATDSDAGWAASGAGAFPAAQPNHRCSCKTSAAGCSGQGQAGQVSGPLLAGPASVSLGSCQAACREGRSTVRGSGQGCRREGLGVQLARPVSEIPTQDSAAGVQARPDPAVPAAGEWTPVGPGGRFDKRRAQSPLLDSQRATMYRALSPSAEGEDVNMDVSTPQGTGGLSSTCWTAFSLGCLVRPAFVKFLC
eukprot:1991423-Amphidinium_carterae.1